MTADLHDITCPGCGKKETLYYTLVDDMPQQGCALECSNCWMRGPVALQLGEDHAVKAFSVLANTQAMLQSQAKTIRELSKKDVAQ